MDSIDGGLPSRASPSIYKAQVKFLALAATTYALTKLPISQDLTRTDDDNKDKFEGGSDRGSYAAQSAIDKV